MFKGRVLMITGGTGSFGNAMVRRVLDEDWAEIRIFSRDEKKQEDMRSRFATDKLKFYIGDVRCHRSVEDAMRGVDYVFHAAALKQVPSCEFYPLEAVRTNVLGAENVMRAAIAMGVSKCVVLSTDKAVYPVNAMGMSKAMMEKVMTAMSRIGSRSGTVMCATRYGNVIGSRGSVIPVFAKQLLESQPLTITDPAMTRFLMSLDDAVDLVLFAFRNANQGDIFVQKSPASTVGDLGDAMMKVMDRKVGVRIIGTRHGEKRYETLVSREEMARAEDLTYYYRVPADGRDLNYGRYTREGSVAVSASTEYNSDNTRRLDADSIVQILSTTPYLRNLLNGKGDE